MEDLSTTQTILLCLLVSFVTSIATGIITTSLFQEAPQNVTQTINRVVERTVETIVPQVVGNPTRETTVVVKEEDLVIDAIKKGHDSLVWVVTNSGGQEIRSVGVIVKSDGTILTDKAISSDGAVYSAQFFGDSKPYPVTVVSTSEKSNAMFLRPQVGGTTTQAFSFTTMKRAANVQLGQTVISIGGKEKETVAIGRVNSLRRADGTATSGITDGLESIETDTPLRDGIPGSILINLNGEIVGFENHSATDPTISIYYPVESLRTENPSFFE